MVLTEMHQVLHITEQHLISYLYNYNLVNLKVGCCFMEQNKRFPTTIFYYYVEHDQFYFYGSMAFNFKSILFYSIALFCDQLQI